MQSLDFTGVALAALIVCGPASSSAAVTAPEIGERCELTKPLRVSAKPRNKGPKTKLRQGEKLEVVDIVGAWVEVTTAAGGGFTRKGKLKRVCTKIEAAAPEQSKAKELGQVEPVVESTPLDTEGSAGGGGFGVATTPASAAAEQEAVAPSTVESAAAQSNALDVSKSNPHTEPVAAAPNPGGSSSKSSSQSGPQDSSAEEPASSAPPPDASPLRQVPGELHGMTFSELIVRTKDSAEIGVAKEGIRVELLEELRRWGYNALGAENLVFGKDESNAARFVLGGTVTEVKCRSAWMARNCRIAVEWQLLDRRSEVVVYKVLTYSVERGIPVNDSVKGMKSLIKKSLHRLLARKAFAARLHKDAASEPPPAPTFERATLRACAPSIKRMPEATAEMMTATVLIEAGDGFGSGVLVSPDGFVLTAAHVVSNEEIKVKFQTGQEHRAEVVRFNRRRDVALLRLAGSGFPCLPLATVPAGIGDKLFAVGSPASTELAFSLTAGIVSALREWDGFQFIQTDASINPGNSGGPMLNDRAEVIAVVSWKLAGIGVEGIGFGVPTRAGLDGLGLDLGAQSAPSLMQERHRFDAKKSTSRVAFTDVPDPSLTLKESLATAPADPGQPGTYWLMRAGGVSLCGVGAAGVFLSWLSTISDVTEPQFRRARLANDISWAALVLGGAAFFLAPVLHASPEPKTTAQSLESGPKVSGGLGAGGFLLQVSY